MRSRDDDKPDAGRPPTNIDDGEEGMGLTSHFFISLLGLITPPAMRFSIGGSIPPMAQGALIDYRVRVGGLPVRWRTRITAWEPGQRFVDLQEAGPYRFWSHEHSFHAEGTRTVMQDRVHYTTPLGILGRVAHRLFIGPTLRKIFQYRGDVIRLRFCVS